MMARPEIAAPSNCRARRGFLGAATRMATLNTWSASSILTPNSAEYRTEGPGFKRKLKTPESTRPARAAKAAGRNRRAAFSSSAVRASGERDRAAGIITNRAYTIPPTSVTADVRCTHRMMVVRNSPIWVSILALWAPYDSRDSSRRHVAVQLLHFRRRNHAPGHGDRSRRRDRPHPGSPGPAPPHRDRHRDHARPHRSHRGRPEAQTGHGGPGIYEPRGQRTPGHAGCAGRLARRAHSRRGGDRRPDEGWRQTPRGRDRSACAPYPGPHPGQHLP